MLYALTDGSRLVEEEHLLAALGLWGYSERCLEHLFGAAIGNAVADGIISMLSKNQTRTRTEIYNGFGRHVRSAQVGVALTELLDRGMIEQVETGSTGGRPAEAYRLTARGTLCA